MTPLLLARSLESFKVLQAAGADVRARSDSGRTALHAAAMFTDAAIVEALLAAGLDPNAREDRRGNTPLLYAGSPETFAALREAGADVHARSDNGQTVLHVAATSTDGATVEALIAAGLDPNAETSSGWTPLRYTAYSGSRETFDALLAGGADFGPIAAVFAPDALEAIRRGDIYSGRAVRQVGRFASASLVARLRAINPAFAEVPDSRRHSPNYPLHYAAQFNDDPTMIAALSTANVNATTKGGHTRLPDAPLYTNTPLGMAAGINGNPAVVAAVIAALPATEPSDGRRRPFLDGGYYDGATPLYLAAASSSPRAAETVGLLLGAGADVGLLWGPSVTYFPLYAAAMTQNLAAMELLIAAGGDVNAVGGGEHGSLLSTVLERGRFDCGYAPVAAALRAAGAESLRWSFSQDPSGRSGHGTYTPHPYVPGPQVVDCETVSAAVQGLIDSGADLEARDSEGLTALHRAAAAGKVVDIRALVTAGAAVDATDRLGRTALHRAARDRDADPAAAAALLAAGAAVDARDNFRRTPLDYATHANINNAAVADLLRAAGGTCRSCDAP